MRRAFLACLAILAGTAASAIVLLAASFSTAPPVRAGNPCFHSFDMPARSVSTSPEVKAMDCAFAPTVAYVPVGTTVTIQNASSFSHLVTGANQEWGTPDVELPVVGKVSYTFDQAGVYPYACALHPGMSGAIVVGDAGPLAPAAAPAAGGPAAASGAGSPGAVEPDGAPIAVLALVAGLVVGAIGAGAIAVRGRRRAAAADGSATRATATATEPPAAG